MHDEGAFLRVMRKRKNKDAIRDATVDQPDKDRPYGKMADLIGSVTGLPPDLSEGTGARFAEFVRERDRKR